MQTDDIGEGKGRACGLFPSQIFPREGTEFLLYKGLRERSMAWWRHLINPLLGTFDLINGEV